MVKIKERRMFSRKIIESDSFLDMDSSSQMLYIHLMLGADDDGFVNNPKKIQRMCGASDIDLEALTDRSFVIQFPSGVIVIKHWKMHNYIPKDRYTPSDYVDEKSLLGLKKSSAYTLDESKMVTRCIQNVTVNKVSIGKDSIDKNKINKCAPKKEKKIAKPDAKSDVDEFFERVWKLYPNKRGKGQVSDAKKKKLYEIGFDELSRAINRYQEHLKRESWKRPQNGSTFFNSGYVDYLDANYNSTENVSSEEPDILDDVF